jgi:CHASE3 domain sensor protein
MRPRKVPNRDAQRGASAGGSRRAGTLQIVAVLLSVAALITLLLVVREYRLHRDASQLLYTRLVKSRDVAIAARSAISALTDAEIREQYYVLTGETVYSEAYADDTRKWQDEFAALELVAVKTPSSPLVHDLSEAGGRTLDELAQTIAISDKDGRDAALARIRKGSGLVYLGKARDLAVQIEHLEEEALDDSSKMLTLLGLRAIERIAAASIALFCFSFAAVVLPIFNRRRERAIEAEADARRHHLDRGVLKAD